MTASPARALVSVDLPAPDGPSSARVRPGTTCGARSAMPSPVVALTASTSTPGAAVATSSRRWAASGTRSALVSTTSGVAPLSQARARNRSIRPRSGSGCRPSVTTATSTLAASTWPYDAPGVTAGAYEGRSSRQDRLGGDPRVRPDAHDDPVADARRGDRVGGTGLQQRAGEGRAQRAVGSRARRRRRGRCGVTRAATWPSCVVGRKASA